MKNYFPLIEFNIDHKFYTDGKCKDLDLVVTNESRKVLNNFKLHFRKSNAWKYVLYVECDENYIDRLKILEKEIKEDSTFLSFILRVEEKRFLTITQNVSMSSDNQFVFIPIDLIDNNETSKLCEFKNYQKTKAKSQFEKEQIKTYPKLLSIVTLNLSESIENLFSKQIEANRTLSISILFEVKSVYWKYIFIPRNNTETELVISDIKQLIQFTEIEWLKLGELQKAGISYSSDEVLLSESYPYQIQLWKIFYNGKSLVVNQLSFPDPENPANFSVGENDKNYISIYQYY